MEQNTKEYTLLHSIRILLIVLVSLISLFIFLPRLETIWASMNAEPRAVTARGELSLAEKSNN